MLTLEAKWVVPGCPTLPKSALMRRRKNGSIVFLDKFSIIKSANEQRLKGEYSFHRAKKEPAVLRFDSKIRFDFYLLYFLLVVVYVVAMGNLSDFMIVFIQFFCDVGENEIRHVAVVHDDVFDDGG